MFSTFLPANALRATAACDFWHETSKKWSVPVSFSTFWLTNVLRATGACNFSTSELQKVHRHPQFLSIFTCKCASRHSGVPFLDIGTAKLALELRCFLHVELNSYLRTCRFSEPTFRTSGPEPRIIEKTQRFATFRTFRACVCIFFLVKLLACWSSFFWLDFFSLLFNCPYIVGS